MNDGATLLGQDTVVAAAKRGDVGVYPDEGHAHAGELAHRGPQAGTARRGVLCPTALDPLHSARGGSVQAPPRSGPLPLVIRPAPMTL